MSSLWNPWVQLFVCENAALIVNLNEFFASSSPEALQKLPSELASEWTDFFVEGTYNLLLPLPVSITGVYILFIKGVFEWVTRKVVYSLKRSTKICVICAFDW